MVDLDTKMKIDALIDYAYDRTIERLNDIENSPRTSRYQTIGFIKKQYETYVLGYVNYYNGCLEGVLFARFLEEFDRMPTPSENAFIADSLEKRFDDLKKICLDLADKLFKEMS